MYYFISCKITKNNTKTLVFADSNFALSLRFKILASLSHFNNVFSVEICQENIAIIIYSASLK